MIRWKTDQEHELTDLMQQGKGIDELAEHFKRSPEAIRLKLRRLGLAIPESTKDVSSTSTPQHVLEPIKPASDLISLEEIMKLLLGALEQLRNSESLSVLQVKRCRLIVSTARTYMSMLERYVHWTDIEQRMVNVEARTLERLKELREHTKDPDEKAKFTEQIKQLEEGLARSSKFYKPFQKKPSLMAPPMPWGTPQV